MCMLGARMHTPHHRRSLGRPAAMEGRGQAGCSVHERPHWAAPLGRRRGTVAQCWNGLQRLLLAFCFSGVSPVSVLLSIRVAVELFSFSNDIVPTSVDLGP